MHQAGFSLYTKGCEFQIYSNRYALHRVKSSGE